MQQRLRSHDITRMLKAAGFPGSEWDGNDWRPGHRTVQQGPWRVHAFHDGDGDGEAEQIQLYADVIRDHGYRVESDQHEGGRRRLIVTRLKP